MKQINRVNVLFVASVSAILHGTLSLVFVPFFSTLLVSLTGPAHLSAADAGMLLAVITPLVYAGAGFALGALMAIGYNMFCWALLPSRIEREVVVEEEVAVAVAVGDAA
ncbi:MAG TPA: hypothetical protein VI685_15380 [Candidatus Angelobacter sp.]